MQITKVWVKIYERQIYKSRVIQIKSKFLVIFGMFLFPKVNLNILYPNNNIKLKGLRI
jgi:hypothetical protein